MKQDHLPQKIIGVFLITLAVYVSIFWFIENRRTANSPWLVTFEVDADGLANLEIRQQSLGIGPVAVQFETRATNAPLAKTLITYNDPKPVPRAAPVGRCMFEDLTFLPGTVALNVCGGDIQLLPRALSIGTNEFPWSHKIIRVRSNGTCEILK